MSDVYKKFAKDTYNIIEAAITLRRIENDGKPVLIISAQSPVDQLIEDTKNSIKRHFKESSAADEEPAMAGAYAHIGAIKAAEQLFGKSNVLVSFQHSPDEIKKILADSKDGKLGKTFEKFFSPDDPAGHAFRYAYENGYRITGSDTGKETAIERAKDKSEAVAKLDETRYETERNAINMMGTVKTGAVVHITSIHHLPLLTGMQYGESPDYQDMPPNPYMDVYGFPLIINSDDHHNPVYKSLAGPDSKILQIEAPGRMDESDKTDIGKRIDEAAKTGIAPQPPSPSPPTPKKFSA